MDICICCYNLTFPQFQYGFYPSSIANLGKMGKPLICPHCDSVLDIIEHKDNAFLYNNDYDDLSSVMCRAFESNKTTKDTIANRLKNAWKFILGKK